MTSRSLIALALTAVAAAACSGSPGPQASSTINGIVTSGGTTPLGGVTVTATPSGGGSQVATTAANGTYTINSRLADRVRDRLRQPRSNRRRIRLARAGGAGA